MTCRCAPDNRCGKCELPTREDLAKESARKNGECGFTRNGHICTLPEGHAGGHRGKPIEKIIPISKQQ